MLPILFPGTPFETPTYFLLYLFGFLGAILMGTRRAIQYGLSPVRAIDFGFFIFIFGVSGARLAHILIEAPRYYLESPVRVFYFWQGGFVLYGGIIAGFFGGVWVARRLKENVPLWADLVAPCLLLGIGIGRMGCLAAGCCYGRPTDSWWGMIFTNPQSGAPLHIALHPTQLLEALFGFVMSAVFWIVYRKPPTRPGEALVMAFMSYAIFRFVLEYFRGDAERGVYLREALSTSQIISIGIVVACLIWLCIPRFRTTKPTSI